MTRSALLTSLSALTLSAAALAGCSSSSGSDEKPASGSSAVTVAIPSDPGSLDPQNSVTSAAGQLVAFAYDSLVAVNEDGEVVPQLAESWTEDGLKLTFTLGTAATCADGSKVDAQLVADNLSYVTDPKNGSPLNGLYMPSGAKVTASGNTVTVETDTPVPFVLNGIAQVPIVCRTGLEDRSTLEHGTNGSGPFQLTEHLVDDHYTYSVRKGYTWGPSGAATSAAGTPGKVTFKVVADESTAANLLTTGGVDIATVYGPDRKRLASQDFDHEDLQNVAGEFFFNEESGRAVTDLAVRRALIQALDLEELGQVVTDGAFVPSTGMVTLEPTACSGDTVTGNLPEPGMDQAAASLEEAGWTKEGDTWSKDGKPLEVTFLYGTGQGIVNAAELTMKQWTTLGVKVTAKTKDDSALNDMLFSTGGWDVTSNTFQVQFPSQLVPFLTGPGPEDGGTNFAHLANADYERLSKEAATMPGSSGCDTWIDAESSLVKHLDIVPYANMTVPVWSRGVEFRETAYGIDPTSLKVKS